MQSLSRDAEKLKGKATASYEQAARSCDEIIAELDHLRALVERDGPATLVHAVPQAVNKSKAATDAALASHKEYYGQLSKWQKAVDKKFNQTVLPLLGTGDDRSSAGGPSKEPASRPFESIEARRALDKVIASHLVRQGRFDVADVFMSESGIRVPPKDYAQCRQLHRILDAIRLGDLGPALEWAGENRAWLVERASPLEYDLHRSHFIRLLTHVDGPSSSSEEPMAVDVPAVVNGGGGGGGAVAKPAPVTPAEAGARRAALAYGQEHFPPFFPTRWQESVRLTSSVLYAPLGRMRLSPYADLVAPPPPPTSVARAPADAAGPGSPWVHGHHLVPLFTKEFSARLGWSRELPLVVATDMGSGGALAKIAKVRSVMKEKRTEWSQADELPVEITLPVPYRFHSVFACPVSKEQATPSNPPMMMVCGHVISRESLTKLARGGGTVKCPYCPSSASMSQAMQVYF